MPIFLILLLTALVLDLPWPPSPFGNSSSGTGLAVAGLVLCCFGVSLMSSLRVAISAQESLSRHQSAIRWYNRWRRLSFFVNLAIQGLALSLFGWGHVIQTECRAPWDGSLFPLAELLVPLPYLACVMLNWFAYWLAERTLFRRQHGQKPYPGVLEFWLHQARQLLFLVTLPAILFATQHSLSRLLPITSREAWYQILIGLTPVVFLIAFPLFIKLLFGWKPMPIGPLRGRMMANSARLRVRVRDFLLMNTHGTMANAMVIGLVPAARYVVFTDVILEGMTDAELDAVLGHELGHVRHHHLGFFVVFLLLSSIAMTSLLVMLVAVLEAVFGEAGLVAALAVISGGLHLPFGEFRSEYLSLAMLAAMGCYLFVVFGWLSRAFERQADLYGSHAVSCTQPHCLDHDSDSVLHARYLCDTGLRTMSLALEKVMVLNGADAGMNATWSLRKRLLSWLRSWQHGPMSTRINFLYDVIGNRDLAVQHHRKVFRMKLGLMATLIVITLLGVLVSSSDFLKWLDLEGSLGTR